MSALPAGKETNILVIDDEKGIRDFLSYELEAQGYGVVTAADGEDGLGEFQKQKFHVVISDIMMPRMDGVKLLEEVKRIDPDVEVIMTTGYGNVETAVAAMKRGAFDFIQKPFNLDEILNLVQKALERSEMKALIALYKTSQAVFSALEEADLLKSARELSLRLLAADAVSILLTGRDGGGEEGADGPAHRLAKHLAAQAGAMEKPMILSAPLDRDPRSAGVEGCDAVRSALVCPLRAKKEVLGLLSIVRTDSDAAFTRSDLRNAQIFISQISQAIDNARLYGELQRNVADLKQAYTELSDMKNERVQTEKLAAIGELASGVAHELNNPLTSIIGLADLLLEEKGHDVQAREDFKTIKEQADRCRKIILNLLNFARKQKSDIRFWKLNDVVEKALELLHYELRNNRVEVVKRLDPSLPQLRIDANRIQQVFLNIIHNACDALASRSEPRLEICSQKTKSHVQVVFKDNGCGVPAAVQSRIFDPFFTTKEVGKGTGLGLSISFGIVKDHGGSIALDSREGEGTTFTVSIPIQA